MVLHDLRFGARLMWRRPAFAVVTIATLALGIGANTAIFTVIDRVILRAVPFPDAGELVVVWETNPSLPVPVMVASPPTFHDWQTRNRVFDSMGAFRWRSVTVSPSSTPGGSGSAEPEQVRGATVTAGLLRVLAVQPRLGRLFSDEEDRPKAAPVVLIADSLARRRFGSNSNPIGQTLRVDGVPHEVVGVMPPGYLAPPPVVFRGRPPAERAELWVPLATDLAAGQRGAHNLTVVARLRDGITVDAADADVKRIAAEVVREHPDYREWNARVVPLSGWVTESSRRSMALLAGAVGFVLLLACANVANLLLARGVGRRKEFAIRTALGAGRLRLAMQVISESLSLAVAGGIVGVALAAGLVRLIVTRGPSAIPGVRDAALDGRAIAFALAVSSVAAVLAGLAPALRVMSARIKEWLADRGGGPGPRAIRVQKGLVVAQIALAMALLVTATLLVESFRQLRAVDTGFRTDDVVTAKAVVPAARYPNAEARVQFIERLLSELRSAPGITSVAVTDTVPLADSRQGTSFARSDAPPPESSSAITANFAVVSDAFFETLGMRLLSGRTFTERDTLNSPRVVVINERLARQHFASDDPLGRLVRLGISTQAPFEVVGVVSDDRHVGVDADPTPTFFAAYRQFPQAAALREVSVIARGTSAPHIVNGIRAVIRGIDREMALFQVQTMEQVVGAAVATPRSLAWVLSSFALTGLLLAAIGVFGVLSHGVTQRTQEIGVRLAVGASPGEVLRMVVVEGMVQVALGIGAGSIIALATSRLLSGLLFGVQAVSFTPYVAVAALLAAVTAIACLAPARRAMKVDPVRALRAD
jgi:putative ABC transport system permease protein